MKPSDRPDPIEQDDLFEGTLPPGTAAPAAQAPSDALARLKVAPAGSQHLSAAQQKFNRLLARVNNMERLLQGLQQRADQLRIPHLQRMDELQRRIARAQQAMAHGLHQRLQRDGLTPPQQRSARALLRDLLQAAPAPEGDAEWAQLQALYVPAQPQGASQAEALRQLVEHLEEMTGQRLEVPDLEQIQSPEQLMAALLRQQQEAAQARQERRAERQARRKPTARQAQMQAQQQDARTALRGIFRQLASRLHPDRESDPAERERKHALMSQANAAHERGDLLALLRLQLAAEQVDEAAMARLGDERLAALSLLLQQQVGTLDRELAEAEWRLTDALGVDVQARHAPHVLAQQLQAQQQHLQEVAEAMEEDLQRVQDDAELKRWLRAQAQLARQHARSVQALGDFNPFR